MSDRATRLTLTEPPAEWLEFCRKNRPDLVAWDVFEQFKDFWIAKPGKDGTKLDWTATWRNWVRGQRVKLGQYASMPAVRDTSKPLPERSSPDSPAYLQFKESWRQLLRRPKTEHPDVIGSFVSVGSAILDHKRETDDEKERRLEREAIASEAM